MPRAIVYDEPTPAEEHYAALLADQPRPPNTTERRELRLLASQLAKRVAPSSVRPYYVLGLAERPDANEALKAGDLWRAAADRATRGEPLPLGAQGKVDAVAQPQPSTDTYLDKLAKYVPAETVTITTLAFAAIQPSKNAVWWLVAGGAVANLLYLFGTALAARPKVPMPRWYFYPLSAAALALWAIAVIGPVGRKVGISGSNADTQKTFVLATAAFIVPLLDTIASGLTDIRKQKH